MLIAAAAQHRLPLVATNDVRHATADGRPLLDVLTCIRDKTTLDAAGRLLLRQRRAPSQAAARDGGAVPRSAGGASRNTRRIAEQCAFTLADLGYRFPDYPLPPGETPIGHLRALTDAGARERYGAHHAAGCAASSSTSCASSASSTSPATSSSSGTSCASAASSGILAQGRGSAANSAVCYALGITAVDPVGMELLFERFLSEERGEWPDIDIDLPSGDQRERVIQYVYQRYGAARRGDDRQRHHLPHAQRRARGRQGAGLLARRRSTGCRSCCSRFEFRDDLDELAVQLQGRRRRSAGAARAAAGRPRRRASRTCRATSASTPAAWSSPPAGSTRWCRSSRRRCPGRVVVQWDKDDCADLGIIKVDLLGLGMMAVLEDAIPLIREHEGDRRRPRPPAAGRSGDLRRCCAAPTPSASSRSRAGRRWRPCRACGRSASTTWSSRWRSSAPARSSARWCTRT